MIFCAKCGAKNKAGDQYCANCGAKLIKPSKLKQPMQQTKPLRQAKPSKKRVDVKKSRHGKRAAVIGVVALLILAAGYGFGKSYYAKDKQIDRIISVLKDPSQDLSPYVKTDDSSFQLTKKSVRPLQTYYKENKTAANNLGSDTVNSFV